jgi:hypothetical protein
MPAPSPRPVPGSTVQLTADSLYVADFAQDGVLLASPPGLVAIAKESGPIKIRSKFADGAGAVETRTYAGPHVWIVESAGTGTVYLTYVPFGPKSAADIKTAIVDVQHGAQPPPPKPDDDDKKDDDKNPEPVKSFRVVFVVESGDTLTASENGVIYGAEVEKWLTANCTDGKDGWRLRDKDATGGKDTEVMNALWSAVQPKVTGTPCVAVAVNNKVEIIPLEPTPAAMVNKFKTYFEGK